MFKIGEFISSINNAGVVRNNRFIVEFTLPDYLQSNGSQYGGNLVSLRCEAAQFPGTSFQSIDGQLRLGYGPIESIPYGIAYDDISLTFLMDGKSRIHKLFYDWTNTIVNFQGSRGQKDWTNKNNRNTGAAAYEVGYKSKYCTDLKITVYDPQDKAIMYVNVYKAFPKQLPAVDLQWASTDELVKMTIPFTYTDFDVVYPRI